MLFQKNIIKKYLALLEPECLQRAWAQYKSYFLNTEVQQNILQSKEEQFQEGFLRELFVKVFGYTLNPSPEYNLITEQKNETDAKKADGAILQDGKVIGVIELKDHKTTDLSKVEAQAFNYKSQHPDARLVVISNFEKLRIYIDNAVEYREWNLFHLTEEEFRELYLCLAWPQVERGVACTMKQESVSSEDQITKALYKDYSQFKQALFADIVKNNPAKEGTDEKEWQLLLFKKTQKLLDRLLFIFFAEDGGLLPPNSMMTIITWWEQRVENDDYTPLYDQIKKYFCKMNTGFHGKKYDIFAYNGGLFKPDEVLDNIVISDEPLVEHTRRLSTYDFESEVDVNILGHIFENSLSEIEEVSQQINSGEKPQTSKRKQDGVFYTPQYITKYIVENTVGRLCTEKKSELCIVEEEYFADKNRKPAEKKALMAKLEQYRDWLLQITILDPACGSGAFLNAALQFLMNEHALIDEMDAKLTGASIVFQNVENSILENNLYGVDINEESVEIAQLALWLRTAKPHRKLNTLNRNIKCGNSLISDPTVAGAKAFDWQKEFPQVFEKGGFDVVIGNPPYVLCQPSNTDEATLNYYKTFDVASYKIDLFHLFFEKGIALLKKRGLLGFITPNTYLTNKYIKPLRNHILLFTDVISIIDHDEKVFEDASVDVSTIILRKDKQDGHFVDILHSNDNRITTLIHQKRQSDWANDTENIFNIKKDFVLNLNNSTPLGDICQSYFGIQAYDRKTSISNEKINENYLPIIDGEDIHPYTFSLPTKFFNYKEEYIKSGGDWSVYSRKRIVIRQIGKWPVVGMCEKEILSSNTMYSLYTKIDGYDIRYLLCILNSSLIKSYWLSKYSDSKQTFPKIKGYQIKELPIHECIDQLPFIDLADKMLSLNSQLQEKRSRFLRRLSENMEVVKITTALLTFDQMDFAGFVAELKKQKIKLSLPQQDEWEDYFHQYSDACHQLSDQIAATDREIDLRVYHLYGLTYDEVLTVDPNTTITKEEYERENKI